MGKHRHSVATSNIFDEVEEKIELIISCVLH